MRSRVKIIQHALEEIYGVGSMVKSLSIVIDNRWDELNEQPEEGERDRLTMEVWYWFSGGDTAHHAAESVREAVRQQEEFLLRPARPVVYPRQEIRGE